jgi:hypothetical protein
MHTVFNYDLPMETMPAHIPTTIPTDVRLDQTQWITRCAQRLHQRWRTVGPAQLEELAGMIWQDTRLRCMEPADAAALWLAPVAPARPSA